MTDRELDAMLTGADDDLQHAIRSTLDVDAGLDAITGPPIPQAFVSASPASQSVFQRRLASRANSEPWRRAQRRRRSAEVAKRRRPAEGQKSIESK